MKRILTLAIFLSLFSLAAFGQGFLNITPGDPNSSNPCTVGEWVNQTTGTIWVCKAGAWSSVLGGADGITFNGVAFTPPTTTSRVTLASGKTFTVNNGVGLSGCDGCTYTLPNASVTVPGATITDCGTSASCAAPNSQIANLKIATGRLTFAASTTASVTGITPAFTATNTYSCSIYNPSHNYTWNFTTQTTTGFTITAGTSNSDTWSWTCLGW